MNITGNNFFGVKWDGKAIEAINIVAEALKINAEALLGLTSVFSTQNIKIESLIKCQGVNETKPKKSREFTL